jgi:hypothetical protein
MLWLFAFQRSCSSSEARAISSSSFICVPPNRCSAAAWARNLGFSVSFDMERWGRRFVYVAVLSQLSSSSSRVLGYAKERYSCRRGCVPSWDVEVEGRPVLIDLQRMIGCLRVILAAFLQLFTGAPPPSRFGGNAADHSMKSRSSKRMILESRIFISAFQPLPTPWNSALFPRIWRKICGQLSVRNHNLALSLKRPEEATFSPCWIFSLRWRYSSQPQ